jgi:hypothetical protein
MKTLLRIRYAALSGVLLIAGFAFAQYPSQDSYPDRYPDQYQNQYPDQDADPPGRVARLQYVHGGVSLQPGGVDDWVDVSLNRPLTTGDRIWVDRNSRAELSIGSAVLRASEESTLEFLNLNDDTAQIELDRGTLHLTVRYLDEDEIVEVDTPNVAFMVYEPGEYRFDVWPDSDETAIQIRRGEGEATGQDTALVVYSDYRYLFRDGQSLRYQVDRPFRPDRFERWCARREAEQQSSPSAQYVARGTIGYEALDSYGYWEPTPVYGTVWFPEVYAGWAPYRYGHWAWIEPWGWTWVDDAPWGFAPFHYGRWVHVRGRWGWVPGPVAVRPVYAPALVAWIGGSPSFGVSVGIGVGGVGWVPLGWRDPYIPYYHVSHRYARRVNLANSREVNITIINNYYRTRNVRDRHRTMRKIRYENARVRGAMTAVSGDVFSSGRPVGKRGVVISSRHANRVEFSAGARLVPNKAAVLGGRRPAKAPKGWSAPRRVVARTPPPPPPVRFERQRPLLEKSKGVPLTWQERTRIRSSEPKSAIRHGRPAQVITAPGSKEREMRRKRSPGLFEGVQPSEAPSGRQRARPAPSASEPPAREMRRPTTPERREAAPKEREERRPEAQPQAAPQRRPRSPGLLQGVQPSEAPSGQKWSRPAPAAKEAPAREMKPSAPPERKQAAPSPSRPEAPPSGVREDRRAPAAKQPPARTATPATPAPASKAAPQQPQQRRQATPNKRGKQKAGAGEKRSRDERGKDGENGKDRKHGSRTR